MDNPWDLKSDDSRSSDSITNFIIFCEDSVSEPIYFKYFETDKIKVNCIENQRNMMKNVVNAIHHCKTTGLLNHVEGEECILEGTQVWCVFDRDKETQQEEIEKGDIEFDASILTAISKGINVAWSNDSFELWILLHFEDITDEDTERQIYYDKLTEIFRQIPNPNDDLVKALAHASFGYKRDFKSANNFRNIVRNEIVSNTLVAIDRAKKLADSYDDDLACHKKSPITYVYKLVEELLKYGEKEIQDENEGSL